MERDRNLLFGIFAVQIKGVAPKQIVEAGAAWATDTSKPLSARLVELGALSDADVALIDQLVNAAVAAHSGDASSALISLGGEEQVDKTFRGSIIMKPSGGLDTRPMTTDSFLGEPVAVLSTVEEYPGRYSHISEYGRGGMGRVLLVHDEHMGRDVALKELLMPKSEWPGPGDSPAQGSAAVTARFLQEARLTGKLEHPAIVPVYELGRRKNGTLYYTMKLVRGKTLSKALRECKNLQDRLSLLSNFVDLCQAVAYAHSRGVIHRDIKPANVMVGAFGETVVLDWGLAKGRDVPDIYGKELESTIRNLQLKVKDKPKPDVTPFETRVGEAVGTPHYMSPEQAEGRIPDITERSDIYSLGVVLYELLTGKVPFDGPSIDEIFWRLLNDAPPDVEKLEPNAPPELIEVCKKAMSKAADKRYESAAALAEEIKRFMSGSFVQAYKYTPAQVLTRYYRQHRLMVNTVAAGIIALISLGIFSYVNILQARNNERDQRVLAEAATVTAEAARDAEAKARDEAESQQYVAQLRLAQSYIEDQQMPLANTALDKAPAQLRDWVWGYLKGQANQAKFRIYSEKSVIFWAKFDPTGKFIVALRNPEPPGMWDAETGAHIRDFEGAEALYNNAAFNADGSRFAAIGEAGIDVWDTATGKQLHHLAHATMGYDLAFPPDTATVWGSYEDGLLIEWDVATGQSVRTFNTETKEIGGLRIADGVLLAAANTNIVQGWDLATGTRLYSHPGNSTWPAPDGKSFLIGNGNTLYLHETRTGTLLQTLEGHTQSIVHASFSSDGEKILTCSRDADIRVWSAGQPELDPSIIPLDGVVYAYFIDNDTRIVGCSGQNTYRVWNAKTNNEMYKFTGTNPALTLGDLSPDGQTLLSAMAFRSVEAFDVVVPGTIKKSWSELPRELESTVVELDFDRSYRRMAARLGSGRLLKFDLERWTPVGQDTGFANVDNISVSANGERIAFVSGPRIVVQAFDTGVSVFERDTEGQDIKSLALNHDGTGVVAGDAVGSIVVWDIASGVRILKSFADKPIYALDWMPDGESLVAGTSSGTLMIIDKNLDKVLRSADAHATAVIDIAVQPTGEFVASLAWDGTYAIWESSTLDRTASFHAESPSISADDNSTWIKFSDKGDYLVMRSLYVDMVLIGMRQMDVLLMMDSDWALFPSTEKNGGFSVSYFGSVNLQAF